MNCFPDHVWFSGCFILYEPQLGTPDWAHREGLVLRRDTPGGLGAVDGLAKREARRRGESCGEYLSREVWE